MENNLKISTIESFVALWATVDGIKVDVEPVEIPFIPAIFVENEITLSEETQSAELFIYGIPQVLGKVSVRIICCLIGLNNLYNKYNLTIFFRN